MPGSLYDNRCCVPHTCWWLVKQHAGNSLLRAGAVTIGGRGGGGGRESHTVSKAVQPAQVAVKQR